MSNLKLFSVFLGGRADRCNVELHDVVFVVGSSLEETYSLFVQKWFGDPDRIHIDTYVELNGVDQYQIEILPKTKEDENPLKLFFINFGAYQKDYFGEVHQTAFYVAHNKAKAIERARIELCCGMLEVHCNDSLVVDELLDEAFDIYDVIEISEVDGYSLHFKEMEEKHPLKIVAGYIKFLPKLHGQPK